MNDEDFRIIVGRKLKELRLAKGYSQLTLNLKMKVAIGGQSLSQYENGSHLPTLAKFKKVCDALDITMEEFFRQINL